MLIPIVVAGHRVSGLATRLNKGARQGVITHAPGDMQRPATAAPIRIAAVSAIVPVFKTLEIGQHVGKSPAFGPHVAPRVVIAGMAPHVNHAVDRTRPADHFATRCGQPSAPQMRLGFGLIAPIIAGHIHRIAQRAGHIDERTPIRPAVLDYNDTFTSLGQPVRHGAPGTSSANNNILCPHQARPAKWLFSIPFISKGLKGKTTPSKIRKRHLKSRV